MPGLAGDRPEQSSFFSTLLALILHASRHTHGNMPHQPHDPDWADATRRVKVPPGRDGTVETAVILIRSGLISHTVCAKYKPPQENSGLTAGVDPLGPGPESLCNNRGLWY